ncbi:carbon storage regulator [Pseudoxanthomonas kaohsiungensis]|uniref:Carbon storage regulator n=1 Tax=Pseudoxanthomonas kaohsiungensis TaxID=283923 RepID=A0ABW3LXV3_9GAMM|nr:carbon storage regulator [Pseudoxanthomonas kaohsiungensis]KAF1702877.1 carbon storage regulator [Pseudoxanthomonas kaohsiungensis]
MQIFELAAGEGVRVGTDILVAVAQLSSGGHVRFAIEAPRQVEVHRGEVYDRIQREGQPGDR